MKTIKFLIACVAMVVNQVSYAQCPEQSGLNCGSNELPADFATQYCLFKDIVTTRMYFPRTNTDRCIGADKLQSYLEYNKGVNRYYFTKENMPWGSYFFPCAEGGVTYRNTTGDAPVSSNLKWAEYQTMTTEQINHLSPAEKMDLYLGLVDFDITKHEMQWRGKERPSTNDDGFCGFCNGARTSSAMLPEPLKEITVQSLYPGSAQRITFTPADLKALSAASYNYNQKSWSFGTNQKPGEPTIDINPALFDITLRLYLAEEKIPFFMDVMPGNQNWNETVIGYNRVLGSLKTISGHPARKFSVEVSTLTYSLDECPLNNTANARVKGLNYSIKDVYADSSFATSFINPEGGRPLIKKTQHRYKLFLDANRKIIDGEWLSEPVDYAFLATGIGTDHLNHDRDVNKGNKALDFYKLFPLVQAASN